MPLGKGYTVESQITGADTVGGIQIDVIPAYDARIAFYDDEGRSLNVYKTPRELGLLSGSVIRMASFDSYNEDPHSMSQRRDFAIPNDPATVELRAFYDTSLKLTPLLLRKIDFLQNYVVKLTTPPHGDYGINCSSRLHLVLRLRGGGHPDEEVRSGFAAGGKISQKINRDPLPTIAYDHSRAQQFHITVINAAYFTSLTGLPCPPSPISPQTYLRHKLPWFTLYDEDIPTANNAKSVTPLAGVRSIAQVDAIRAKADCAYCVHQMATKSASPCGHGVCDECSTVSACPSCQKRITGWQQFTEVVPMPGHEDDDGVEALSLDERIVRLKSCHYGRVMSFRVKGSDVSPLCR